MTLKYNVKSLFCVFLVIFLIGCGEESQKENSVNNKTHKVEKKVKDNTPPSIRVDLTSKGVGPIKSITFDKEINTTKAEEGATIFNQKCSACHKVEKKFIGPGVTGVLKRRTPEWVMNMILNPEEMVIKDSLAKALLIEFNGAPMANQSLTEENARAILEYFRTLN